MTGPPGSGKTTLWRAVTGGARGDVAVVAVPDERVQTLASLHGSRKTTPVGIEVVDVHATARSEGAAVARLREMDAILAVLPAFGGQDPQPALRALLEDMALADMAPIEKRLERARKDAAARREVPSLEAALAALEAGRLLAQEAWEPADRAVFSPISPVTLKPLVLVHNVDEEGLGRPIPDAGLLSFAVSAALEEEVAGLPSEEALPLLEAFGVKEPAAGRVVDAVYRSLDLITFLTTGDKESRAWEVRRGATAPEAAGVIHSDLQRGFIRAEVVPYEELVAAGSWNAAKAKGLIRVEGREYVVGEGDVVLFRFAV